MSDPENPEKHETLKIVTSLDIHPDTFKFICMLAFLMVHGPSITINVTFHRLYVWKISIISVKRTIDYGN